MEVILLKDVLHTGRRGDVVDVKPGYARNYLLPHGYALEASSSNRKVFDQMRTRIEAEHARERDAAAAVAAAIAGLNVSIAKRVGETETLYGSVTASEVADGLSAKGVEVDRRRIDLGGGIKTIGEHTVRIDLHSDVTAELAVTVVPEE